MLIESVEAPTKRTYERARKQGGYRNGFIEARCPHPRSPSGSRCLKKIRKSNQVFTRKNYHWTQISARPVYCVTRIKTIMQWLGMTARTQKIINRNKTAKNSKRDARRSKLLVIRCVYVRNKYVIYDSVYLCVYARAYALCIACFIVYVERKEYRSFIQFKIRVDYDEQDG